MQKTFRSYLGPILIMLLAAFLVFNVILTVQCIISFYTPLPIRDYWRVVQNLQDYRAFHLSVLWKQHNEHRIIFPEIIFAADMLLCRGRMLLPIVLSFICYAATWLLLSSTVLSDHELSSTHRVTAVLISGILALFETSTLVLAVPFLLQWTLMQLAVACSFVCLSRIHDRQFAIFVCGTIIAATVATYSCGNGLALWPLLMLLATLLRMSRLGLFTLGAFAIVSLILYFIGYQPTSKLNLSNFIAHPIYSFGFIASYLSMPFGGMKAPLFGVTVGTINLLLAVVFFVLAWRTRLIVYRPAIVLFSFYVFTLFAAVMTASGRMDPAESSFLAAKAVRYISVPQMNWAALILIVLWLSAKSRQHRILFPAFSFLFVIGSCIAFVKLDRWLASNAQ